MLFKIKNQYSNVDSNYITTQDYITFEESLGAKV